MSSASRTTLQLDVLCDPVLGDMIVNASLPVLQAWLSPLSFLEEGLCKAQGATAIHKAGRAERTGEPWLFSDSLSHQNSPRLLSAWEKRSFLIYASSCRFFWYLQLSQTLNLQVRGNGEPHFNIFSWPSNLLVEDETERTLLNESPGCAHGESLLTRTSREFLDRDADIKA